ncbi:MAG TPA: Mur ligase family protein, partial [Bdellovibrionota bacterium]|nr:Mur ligase family protein [Bdellovibrionota bacterium]
MKKTVHLMGIGGTGMVSLAGMFQETGWNVRGSDSKIYPPTSTELERLKIPVAEGYKPENLQPPPDLVIVGNVVSRGNPEVEALLKTSIPYTSMAQALAKYFLEGRRSVVVAGTHGKTTTTSLLAWILLKGGRDPGLFVGGMPKNFGQGYRIGSGEPFVVEGDEYDTAFFEKSPKFLHYTPQDVIITSIEFDHADIYRDLDHVIEQFEKLVALLPKEGTLLAWGGSDTVKKICSKRKDGEPQYYGCDSCHDWRALDTRVTSTGTAFDVEYQGKILTHIESPLLGKHNVLNAVAAIGMATKLGVNPEDSLKAVSTFEGIRRRQEFLGEARGVRVYDDFAHHPTAVAETLAAFRPMADARKGRLWAIYE